jgi:FKBP-type peptidyl-prolyl cis-trans isomerase FklB
MCVLLLVAGACAHAADAPTITSPNERLSYSIGASIGKNLKKETPEVDLNVVIEGLKAAFGAEALRLPEREVRIVLGEYQTQLRQKALSARQLAVVENKKAGDAFLESNKAKPGVAVLPNGVQFRVLREGTGPKPTLMDTVVVSYRGSLINGTEFDATQTDKPLSLKVAALINGWKDALLHMPVGSKWEIVIPPQLAYGERGSGEIGPNEVLRFDVDLLQIK